MIGVTTAARDERGMSVVELTIASSLIVLIVALFGDQLFASMQFTHAATSHSQSTEEARNAMARVERDVRSASTISVPAPWASGSSLEILTYAGVPGAGAPQWVRYRVITGTLYRSLGGTAPTPSWGGDAVVAKHLVSFATVFQHCPAAWDEEHGTVVLDFSVQVAADQPARRLRTEITARNTVVPATSSSTTTAPCG